MASHPYCVVGYYYSPEDILEATRKTKERGFKDFDSFTPFPIHGMEHAMGMKRTPLPYISFVAGAIGLCTAFFLTAWTHYISWPLNIGGKPLFALPAYIPIMFELTVLFAGVTTAVVMFTYFLGLPNFKKKVFHPDITNDRFALAIQVHSQDEVEPVKKFLRELKADEIHHVEGPL